MKELLLKVRRLGCETCFPDSAEEQGRDQPDSKSLSERVARSQEIESGGHGELRVGSEDEVDHRCVERGEPEPLVGRADEQRTAPGVLDMQVCKKRRQETQAETEDGPREDIQSFRRLRVIELGIEGEERTGIEEKQSEAEEEEDTFEIALAAVAEDDHHPEEREEGAGGETDQANVEQCTHRESREDAIYGDSWKESNHEKAESNRRTPKRSASEDESYAGEESRAMAQCKEFLASCKIKKIQCL